MFLNWKSISSIRHNNVELFGIPNDIIKYDLEEVLINICQYSGLEIQPKDIGVCHPLPICRNIRDSNKRVIIIFVNRKYPEVLLENHQRFFSLSIRGDVFVSFSFWP